MKKIIYILILLFTFNIVFAQTLSTSLDKQKIDLGEPATFKIMVKNLQGKEVVSAPKNELLPFHLEEINDTFAVEADYYERTIEFAIFEEGTFSIPSFDIIIGNEIYKTTPYEIEVKNPAQQGTPIHDIMKNKQLNLDVVDYWELYKWYVLASLAVFCIIFLVWQFILYGKKRKNSPVVLTNQTLKLLDQLKNKKYIENHNFRAFYVELLDISRAFLAKQYHIPADVLLTDDLVELLKTNQTISAENEKIIEEIFLRGDMVKFAKFFPDENTATEDWAKIKKFVKKSSKDLEFENLRKDV